MKVLYATDGFDPAVDAGQVLERIADRDRVEITVMSVTHAGIPSPEHFPLMLDAAAARRKDTIAIVDAAAEKLVAAGFRATGRTAEGHPGQEIVTAITEDWYDLVVMGGGRRTWLGNHLLGSVSSYVLHSSPWSVLIVHECRPSDDRARILFGADGSRGAEFTIRTIERFADRDRTQIEVASVAPHPIPFFVPAPGAIYAAPEMAAYEEETRTALHDQAQRCVDASVDDLTGSGFVVHGSVMAGNPSEQLLRRASNGAFDLVAVGSRGRGPVRRALLGSVSDHLAHHATAALVGRRLDP